MLLQTAGKPLARDAELTRCRLPRTSWTRHLSVLAMTRLAMVLCLCVAPVRAAITLDGRATILVQPNEPKGVQLAAQDLASDMEKVFGTAPQIVHSEAETGLVTIVLGDQGTGAPAEHASAPEAFSITACLLGGRKQHQRAMIRLAGSGVRGTIFAIYEFSQQYLGVDPMYYWTDHAPMRRAAVTVPVPLKRTYPPPVFRYRGFFINDEDLLTGWAPGETKDGTGISLAVWNKICETILRLKGNMIVAGTWPFANEPQDRVVMDRGLFLNQHHAEPLGVNFSRWPASVPYNFSADPQYIERAWKHAVDAYPKDQQILWEVGLRGLSDQPYSALDPSVRNNPQAEGRLISKAIAEQVRFVQEQHPNAVFITDLWMEGSKLMQSGDLKIPPNVITVWPDTGYGDMQDDGRVQAGQGAYIHVAMENGDANQLSELTPVSRIFSSLGRFQQAGATSFLLVNTSDIRPVTMGASAVLNFGWQGERVGTSDAFYQRWAEEEFGSQAASAVAAVYKAYFEAPADRSVKSPRPYGDNYYHKTARSLMRSTMVQWPTFYIPGQAPFWEKASPQPVPFNPEWAPTQAEKERVVCEAAAKRWDAVWEQAVAAKNLVAPERRDFYQAGVLTMIAINRQSNAMLAAIAEAVLALQKGDTAMASAKTDETLAALDAIKVAEASAEYGKSTLR